MELDIGYNTTLKAAELNAIMINKVFFFLTKKKKSCHQVWWLRYFGLSVEVYRTVWLKWSFCYVFS